MDLYFSTVVRRAPLQHGGEVVHLSWDAKEVRGRRPVVPTDPDVVDPNPRGGARGGRGVAVIGDRVVVASYHSLLVHDRALHPLDRITGPLFAGLHEVGDAGDGTVWVAATAVDAALRVNVADGQVIEQRWPRQDPGLRRALGIEASDIDPSEDQRQARLLDPDRSDVGHLHLNAVTTSRGRLLGLANHHGAILDLDTGCVVLRDPRLVGAHNLVDAGDETVFTSGTTRASVNRWDLDSGRLVSTIELDGFRWVRAHARPARLSYRAARVRQRLRRGSTGVAHPLFVRGMVLVDGRLFVGVSPAAILELDVTRRTLADAYAYSDSVEHCVHGLAVAA